MRRVNHGTIKQRLHKRRKRLSESFYSRQTSQKSFTLTTHWNLAKHVKILTESSNLYTPSIRDEWYCWKSSTQNKRRYCSSIATIRIGWKMVVWFCGMLLNATVICPKTLWDENSVWWKFGEPLKGPITPFGALVEYHTISARDQSRIHQFGKEVWLGIFLGYELIAGGILERRCSDCGLGRFGAVGWSEIYPRINATEELMTQNGDGFIFPVPDGTAKLWGRDFEFREPTQRREANRESLKRQNQQMTLKPVATSVRFRVTSSLVTTMNLEFNSVCGRNKHSLFHWKTFLWSTRADFDVMHEKRVDDFWNVDSIISLADSWKGFTKFPLKRKTSQGICVVREEIDKSSKYYQTRSCVSWSVDQNW